MPASEARRRNTPQNSIVAPAERRAVGVRTAEGGFRPCVVPGAPRQRTREPRILADARQGQDRVQAPWAAARAMKPKIPEGWILTGWRGRLYPSVEQAARLNQWAGSLRFLWNRLLDLEKAEYAASGKFIWRKELQQIAVGMRSEVGTEWLTDLPAHAVLDVAIRMDGALKRMVAERKAGRRCGFPRPKKKFVNEAGAYAVGENTRMETQDRVRAGRARQEARAVILPKIGRMRLRGGEVASEHKLLSARVSRDGARWMLSVQFATPPPKALPVTEKQSGVDLGVATLATAFDGEGFTEWAAPRRLRKAHKRLRRSARQLSRRRKGSARRRAQARRVGVIHRKVRQQRNNLLHEISHQLTAKAGVLRFETLNVKGMVKNRHLALSVADAGMARLVTFCAYKAAWRGRRVEKIDAWYPSSQLCACCGAQNPAMKTLRRRMFQCAACGHTEGRDRNAARNIYRYSEERRNRATPGPTRGEIGDQDGGNIAPVPIAEPRILDIEVTP